MIHQALRAKQPGTDVVLGDLLPRNFIGRFLRHVQFSIEDEELFAQVEGRSEEYIVRKAVICAWKRVVDSWAQDVIKRQVAELSSFRDG